MHPTPAQALTLKAAIQAIPELAAFYAAGNGNPIAAYFNEPASPQVIVWKDAVTRAEAQALGFDWDAVDTLTVGQARIWDWLFENDERAMVPADAGVRDGIEKCWKGNAAKLAVQAVVLGRCKRPATRFEALFAVGSGTTLSPSTFALDASGQFIAGALSPAEALVP
jgi:hypothetical protein